MERNAVLVVVVILGFRCCGEWLKRARGRWQGAGSKASG
jgi:hypothetical protein